jgi:O-antigen ligase
MTLVFVALVACHICSRRENIRRAWTMMLVLLVVQCFFYSLQRLTDTSFTLEGEVLANRGSSGRFGGTMGMAPMGLATLEMVTLFFTQGRMFSKIWKPNWFVIGVFAYGLLCLLLSLTRSCWIGFIGGSLMLAVISIKRGTMRPAMLGRMAAFGLVALVVAWGPVHDRLGANHQAAADERFLLNYINLEMIKAHPFVGVGINQCFVSRWRYLPSFYTDGDWIYMAHNQYLLVAAETGLIGLAAFLSVLWVSIRSAWRAARSDDLLIREAGTILLISLLAMVWGMNLDFYGGMQVYTFLWFIMGFAAGVGRLADEHAKAMRAVAAQ